MITGLPIYHHIIFFQTSYNTFFYELLWLVCFISFNDMGAYDLFSNHKMSFETCVKTIDYLGYSFDFSEQILPPIF